MAAKVFDSYSTVFLDLDGVIYEGANAIAGAVESVSQLSKSGVPVGYITNNSSRSPETIAQQLRGLGVSVEPAQIISSAQSGVELLQSLAPAGAKVLVVGGPGLRERVAAAGYTIVSDSSENPTAVIQGFAPDVAWHHLAEASYAVAAGASWVATNGDWTIPREKGLAPGNGTLVSAVHTAVGKLPVFAGKPEPAIFQTALREFETDSAIYVGDRLDTDVTGANRAGLGSALVMTGVTTRKELLAAKKEAQPKYILKDLTELLKPYRLPVKTKRGYKLGDCEVELLNDSVVVTFGDPKSLDALKAAALTIWDSDKPIHTLTVESALYE